ncbi:TetR-like C-terminal domain-containing protein [Streptomyces sp. NPDC003710]
MRSRLHRAQELGRIRTGIDGQMLVDQLWGAVYHRLLIPDEPVTDDFVIGLVNNLLGEVRSK